MGTVTLVRPSIAARVVTSILHPLATVEQKIYEASEKNPLDGLRKLQQQGRPAFYVAGGIGDMHNDVLCFFDPRRLSEAQNLWESRSAWQTLQQLKCLKCFLAFSGCQKSGKYYLSSVPQFATELENLLSCRIFFTRQFKCKRGITVYTSPCRLAAIVGEKYYVEARKLDA